MVFSFPRANLFIFPIHISSVIIIYNMMSNLLSKFSLIVEHLKTEVFHFNRLQGSFNLPLLNLSSIGGPILHPKDS